MTIDLQYTAGMAALMLSGLYLQMWLASRFFLFAGSWAKSSSMILLIVFLAPGFGLTVPFILPTANVDIGGTVGHLFVSGREFVFWGSYVILFCVAIYAALRLHSLLHRWKQSEQIATVGGVRLDSESEQILSRVMKEYQVSLVSCKMSDQIDHPVLVGVRKPTIILPAHSACWTDFTLEAVLRHEVVHAKYKHCLVWFLASIMEAGIPTMKRLLPALRESIEQFTDSILLKWCTKEQLDRARQEVIETAKKSHNIDSNEFSFAFARKFDSNSIKQIYSPQGVGKSLMGVVAISFFTTIPTALLIIAAPKSFTYQSPIGDFKYTRQGDTYVHTSTKNKPSSVIIKYQEETGRWLDEVKSWVGYRTYSIPRVVTNQYSKMRIVKEK